MLCLFVVILFLGITSGYAVPTGYAVPAHVQLLDYLSKLCLSMIVWLFLNCAPIYTAAELRSFWSASRYRRS